MNPFSLEATSQTRQILSARCQDVMDKRAAEIVEKHVSALAGCYPSGFLVWTAAVAQRDLEKCIAMKRNKLHSKIDPLCKRGTALAEQVKDATAAAPRLQKHIDTLQDRSGSPRGRGHWGYVSNSGFRFRQPLGRVRRGLSHVNRPPRSGSRVEGQAERDMIERCGFGYVLTLSLSLSRSLGETGVWSRVASIATLPHIVSVSSLGGAAGGRQRHQFFFGRSLGIYLRCACRRFHAHSPGEGSRALNMAKPLARSHAQIV